MANNFLATANRVAAHLGKAPKDFTKEDIIRVVQDFDIRMVNLMYPGGDGRLKTLNFMLNSADISNLRQGPSRSIRHEAMWLPRPLVPPRGRGWRRGSFWDLSNRAW